MVVEAPVLEVERQAGAWLIVGGYAHEVVTERRSTVSFAMDRGLARSLFARAARGLDTSRSLTLEALVRQDGRGAWARAEYSHGWGPHWRTIVTGALIRGDESDFIGRYRLNSRRRRGCPEQ